MGRCGPGREPALPGPGFIFLWQVLFYQWLRRKEHTRAREINTSCVNPASPAAGSGSLAVPVPTSGKMAHHLS